MLYALDLTMKSGGQKSNPNLYKLQSSLFESVLKQVTIYCCRITNPQNCICLRKRRNKTLRIKIQSYDIIKL